MGGAAQGVQPLALGPQVVVVDAVDGDLDHELAAQGPVLPVLGEEDRLGRHARAQVLDVPEARLVGEEVLDLFVEGSDHWASPGWCRPDR